MLRKQKNAYDTKHCFTELPWQAEILQLVVGGGKRRWGREPGGRSGHAVRRVPQGPALKQADQPVERALGRFQQGKLFECVTTL